MKKVTIEVNEYEAGVIMEALELAHDQRASWHNASLHDNSIRQEVKDSRGALRAESKLFVANMKRKFTRAGLKPWLAAEAEMMYRGKARQEKK